MDPSGLRELEEEVGRLWVEIPRSGGGAGMISGILIGGMSLIPVERFRYGIAGIVMVRGS